MDAISQTQVAGSANAVNQVLAAASEAEMKLAEKLMKLAVTMTLKGQEVGKGQNIDVSA
jgi:hypothetical protein